MSYFTFTCLNCGKKEGYWLGVVGVGKKCKHCGAEHYEVGYITGMHIAHNISIWGLKGTKKKGADSMAVMAVSLDRSPNKVFYEDKVEDLISELEELLPDYLKCDYINYESSDSSAKAVVNALVISYNQIGGRTKKIKTLDIKEIYEKKLINLISKIKNKLPESKRKYPERMKYLCRSIGVSSRWMKRILGNKT